MATQTAAIDSLEAKIPELPRAMGLGDVALYFILAGSNFQWVATAAAAGPSALSVWVIGGFAMFVPLSIVVVYLGSHHPDEGGMYIWSKRAFGPLSGFLTGWTYWMSNLPYFPALLYFMVGNALYINGSGTPLAGSPALFIILSIIGLAIGTIFNIYGLGVAKWLNNIGATCRWIGTVVLIALGAVVWMRFGPVTHFTAVALRPTLSVKDVIFWSVIAFAWTGPESMSFMAGEVRNPRRSIPVGLAIAAPVIAAIYIAGTASILAAMPASAVDPTSGVMQTIAHAAKQIGWLGLSPIAA